MSHAVSLNMRRLHSVGYISQKNVCQERVCCISRLAAYWLGSNVVLFQAITLQQASLQFYACYGGCALESLAMCMPGRVQIKTTPSMIVFYHSWDFVSVNAPLVWILQMQIDSAVVP